MTERISELLNMLRDESNCNVLDYVNDAADLIESLAAELEQVKRERDAAVDELDHFCDNCKYVDNAYGEYPCPSRTEYDHCDSCPGWQWRGVKE